MSLTRSLITQQHRPILDQLLVRLSLRQGQWLRLSLERRLGKFAGRVFKGGIGHLSLRLDVSNQRDGKSLLGRGNRPYRWSFVARGLLERRPELGDVPPGMTDNLPV